MNIEISLLKMSKKALTYEDYFKSVDQLKIKINDNLCSTNIDENSSYTPVHMNHRSCILLNVTY